MATMPRGDRVSLRGAECPFCRHINNFMASGNESVIHCDECMGAFTAVAKPAIVYHSFVTGEEK